MENKLKIKYSRIIPFPGYYAITLFGFMVIRKEYEGRPVKDTTINHENIHCAQAYDFCLGFFGYFMFYILYLLEWLIKCIITMCTGFKYRAYRSISFEQEAYNNQKDLDYLDSRKKFSWMKYIFKMVK